MTPTDRTTCSNCNATLDGGQTVLDGITYCNACGDERILFNYMNDGVVTNMLLMAARMPNVTGCRVQIKASLERVETYIANEYDTVVLRGGLENALDKNATRVMCANGVTMQTHEFLGYWIIQLSARDGSAMTLRSVVDGTARSHLFSICATEAQAMHMLETVVAAWRGGARAVVEKPIKQRRGKGAEA